MSSSASINLTIDGRAVSVSGGTILDAAKSVGIDIPTLCHHQSLKPFGSCWICAVKVEGARTLVPSCSTAVREGMKVTSNDAEVRQARKLCLELLLSDHTGDCLGPCQMTCPAGIDIQGYVALAAKGQYREALELIKQRNPLPLICGRVCPHTCEDGCRRNLVDEPVSVNAIKRFVADADAKGGSHYVPAVASPTGKKVAVVGGGPAGLACAYFLAQRGHDVTILERHAKLGGMLRWGIPAYRLPREVLDDEISRIIELGVKVRCNQNLGKDFTVPSLKQEGFDAVFLGIGATLSRKMRVPGEELDGVYAGTDFLYKAGNGDNFDFKGLRVAVVGGGNSAIDAARTSLRFGAKEVTIIYRRGRSEMPAQDIEVEDAEHEGVKFLFLAAPTKLTGQGKLEGLEYVRMELGAPDESGRRRPVEVAGSATTIPVDICISAIGQAPDLAPFKFAKDSALCADGLEKTEHGTLAVDERSLLTKLPYAFAGGDCVNGAATVVEAVAHGREAAVSIDFYLSGKPVERGAPLFNVTKGDLRGLDPADFEHFLRTPRKKASCLAVAERISDFREVENSLPENFIAEEAQRCLSCGCASAFECDIRRLATEYGADSARFPGDKRKEQPDERHPLIKLEMQKCIMCGACVRVCDEVRNVQALGFTGRGFKARVRPAFGDSLLDAGCISCGACVAACPTGAIVEKLGQSPFATTYTDSACAGCGTGCKLEFNVAHGHVFCVSPNSAMEKPNYGQLCLRGKFGHRALASSDALATPMIRKGGKLTPASWDEAISAAASLLASGQASAVVSGHASWEEIMLAKEISEKCDGHLNGYGLAGEAEALSGIAAVLGHCLPQFPVASLRDADFALVVECDPMREHPVAGVEIHQLARRTNKLATLSNSPTRLDGDATLKLRPTTGGSTAALAWLLRQALEKAAGSWSADQKQALLSALGNAKNEEVEKACGIPPSELREAANLLLAAKKPVIIINAAKAGAKLASLAAALAAAVAGEGWQLPLLALRRSANSFGLSLAKALPLVNQGLAGSSALIVREDPVGAGLLSPGKHKLVVADCVLSETAKSAEVLLPLPAPHEMRGLMLASGGWQNKLNSAATPLAGKESADTLSRLAEACKADGKNIPQPKLPETTLAAPELKNALASEAVKPHLPSIDSYARKVAAWAKNLRLAN